MNPELLIPPRPTISNIQWISGTQHVTPADMDLLSKLIHLTRHNITNPPTVGGPDRPPSKRQLAQARSEAEQARRAARAGQPSSSSANPSYPTMSPTSQANEGWGTWATRAFNERTEKLNAVTDNMNNLSANSAGWADDVSKFVGKQKRGFVMGAVKSKFGF
jgi:syntaxin-binding protein 5